MSITERKPALLAHAANTIGTLFEISIGRRQNYCEYSGLPSLIYARASGPTSVHLYHTLWERFYAVKGTRYERPLSSCVHYIKAVVMSLTVSTAVCVVPRMYRMTRLMRHVGINSSCLESLTRDALMKVLHLGVLPAVCSRLVMEETI